jgi:hypothetical protein
MADQLPHCIPEEQCPICEGEGRLPVGEHFVTREMALDACEPAMEGMSMGIEYAQCPECGGMGLRPIPKGTDHD